MKSLRSRPLRFTTMLCLLSVALGASALVAVQPQAPEDDEMTAADARKAIVAAYDRWGRARVELDKKTMDAMLAPDFYVLLYGERLTREKFLTDVSEKRERVRLTRFDVEVLTVRKSDDGWTAVIAEKIEVTMDRPGGETIKGCSLWVTRDGFRREGDKWLVTFSEAIGHENWRPGTPPPISDW